MAFNFSDALDDAIDATGKGISFNPASNTNDFSENGFIVPPIPGADGNGLPSQKVKNRRTGNNTRSLMHWFVPEFGVIKMYINPRQVRYAHKKAINQERTKGGFSLQYWGERLSTLTLTGTTGSSGVEGINVLYEIYRAEQYAFDAVGLTLASDNAASALASQIFGGAGDAIGSAIGGDIGGAIGGSLGSALGGGDPASNALAARNIPSLAQFAFGIELFYLGWVYRGYFDSMNITESADNLGLFEYDIQFVVTERRGYRVNNLAWQKSAVSGPSGEGVPLSFSNIKI